MFKEVLLKEVMNEMSIEERAKQIVSLKNELDRVNREIIGIETHLEKIENDENTDPILISEFYKNINNLELKKEKLEIEIKDLEVGV